MDRRLLTISLATLGLASQLGAQTRTTQLDVVAGEAAVDRTTQTEDVRFRNEYYDRMTVPVRLGGSGPYRFLIDTGADRTAVSRQLAASLSLPAGAVVSLHTMVGVSNVATVKVPDLQLTGKSMRLADAPLLDRGNMGADGILGTDSLVSQRVVFDFTTQTMSVVPSSTPDFRKEPGTIVVQGRRRNGRLVVTDATANGRHLTVVIDTGSQVSVGNDALRSMLLSRELLGPAERIELVAVTGEKIAGDYIFLRELEIGGITLENLAVVFAPAHTFKQLRLDRTPALLLGMNAIRAFKKVSIDFSNKKLRVVVPQHSELDVNVASNRGNVGRLLTTIVADRP